MGAAVPHAARYASDLKEYEREDIIPIWLRCYEIEKERQFIACLDRLIPRERVTLLDVGCGAGLHAFLWSERNKRVTAADISRQFENHILRTYHFPFIRMDVLNCSLAEQYDICFCMGIATILLDEERRFQTFETLSRLVRPSAFLVLISLSNQWPFSLFYKGEALHCLNAPDLAELKRLGFVVERIFCWSSSPKSLWRLPGGRWLGRCIETVNSRLGIGARKVVICRRAYGSSD